MLFHPIPLFALYGCFFSLSFFVIHTFHLPFLTWVFLFLLISSFLSPFSHRLGIYFPFLIFLCYSLCLPLFLHLGVFLVLIFHLPLCPLSCLQDKGVTLATLNALLVLYGLFLPFPSPVHTLSTFVFTPHRLLPCNCFSFLVRVLWRYSFPLRIFSKATAKNILLVFADILLALYVYLKSSCICFLRLSRTSLWANSSNFSRPFTLLWLSPFLGVSRV